MSKKSAQIRLSDLHAIFSLTGECRDIGDDAGGWRRHWFAGIARLAGADLVCGGEKSGLRSGAGATLGTADWGFESGFDRSAWEQSIVEFDQDPEYSPAEVRYIARTLAEDGLALARTDLVPDQEWYPSADFQAIPRSIGIDHIVWCYRTVGGAAADEYSAVLVTRAAGRPDFSAREKAIIQEAHALVAPLIGGPLARFAEPSPGDLSPRVRQVLKCLLEGDGDKQIAARLGISIHTVNQYTKAIFQHFGCRSRAELMARWLRRGWGNRCQWAKE